MRLKDWVDTNKDAFTQRDLNFLIKTCYSHLKFIETEISEESLRFLQEAAQAYRKGTPIAYILGKEEFYGLEFKVDTNVLIPRPETELIVEKALNIIDEHNLARILDLGCGSGNIGISLKKNAQYIDVICSDKSTAAITVAKENALLHNVVIQFICCNLFDGLAKQRFDMIIANPPYVENSQLGELIKHEPMLALDGGVDGLAIIRQILDKGFKHLKTNGFLILEIGYNQKEAVENYLNKLKYVAIEWLKDYSGHFRAVVLKNIY